MPYVGRLHGPKHLEEFDICFDVNAMGVNYQFSFTEQGSHERDA